MVETTSVRIPNKCYPSTPNRHALHFSVAPLTKHAGRCVAAAAKLHPLPLHNHTTYNYTILLVLLQTFHAAYSVTRVVISCVSTLLGVIWCNMSVVDLELRTPAHLFTPTLELAGGVGGGLLAWLVVTLNTQHVMSTLHARIKNKACSLVVPFGAACVFGLT